MTAETQAQRDKRLCEEQWAAPGVGNTAHYSGWRIRGPHPLAPPPGNCTSGPLTALKGRIASTKPATKIKSRKTK